MFIISRDIDMVSRIYQKQKNDPPLDRDHPPIGGKISWARQLFRRIQVLAVQHHCIYLSTQDNLLCEHARYVLNILFKFTFSQIINLLSINN